MQIQMSDWSIKTPFPLFPQFKWWSKSLKRLTHKCSDGPQYLQESERGIAVKKWLSPWIDGKHWKIIVLSGTRIFDKHQEKQELALVFFQGAKEKSQKSASSYQIFVLGGGICFQLLCKTKQEIQQVPPVTFPEELTGASLEATVERFPINWTEFLGWG